MRGVFQDRAAPLAFRPWRGRVRDRLTAAVRPLLDLAPPYGYSPDF